MDRNWSHEQLEYHIKAAKLLDLVMNESFDFIREKKADVTEWQVQQFILDRFAKLKMKTTEMPIVAFGQNTSNVHYFPEKNSAKKLQSGDLIMIDIWARLNKKRAPFADITWMAYLGDQIPEAIQKEIDLVFCARDMAIDFARSTAASRMLPIGSSIDQAAREYLSLNNRGVNFLHSTGHILGLCSPHGVMAALRPSNKKQILINTGYTIEPGVYFKGQFGVRSEIDFYINEKMEIIVTTQIQKQVVVI